ncbi:UDP-N-acetylmuramate dehydrogenase [Ructibacterium gallinarum]|nr:UDP-N-acetylmuramate dehydrogenase [Ructibacterium gallinarum]
MITEAIVRLISEVVGASMVYVNEPMSRHTTFRIGGPADLLVEPANVNQTEAVIKLLRQMKIPYMILGNGSNVLVGDKGIRCVVVKLGKEFGACDVIGTVVKAQAGIKLSRLAGFALGNCLTGLEFAAGIPGTLGGAVYMNAGAYGGEMKDVVRQVTYLDSMGHRGTMTAKECAFGYRDSFFARHPECVILECEIQLQNGDKEKIRARMDELAAKRVEKQPLNLPSAGSTFKRPEGAFAGKLIQDAGLMGLRVGGASVSKKHAGFVVNDQGASAEDVRKLIALVQEKVKEKFQIELQPEVKFIGEF